MLTLCACLGVAACETPQQAVQQQENLLAAAGFDVLPANTPARRAELASLPPGRFYTETRSGRVIYLYPDPLVCNCLYIGHQDAYGRYRQEQFQAGLAEQRLEAAQLNQEAGWGWGPWGTGWWYP